MKKVVLIFTLIIAITSVVFAVLEFNSYNDKKNKIDNNTLIQEVEEKIEEVKTTINEKNEQVEKVKEEKKEQIEELEKWQEKTKEMASNL